MATLPVQPSAAPRIALLVHFAPLVDPRQSAKILYPLEEIVLLVVCATIVGADDLVEVREWGLEHLDFLRTHLAFRDDIPSHDTLADVMNAVDPELFKQCFTDWVTSLRDGDPDIIAIDGKTSRYAEGMLPARRMTGPRIASPCIWFRPGRAVSASCSASRRPRRSPTRSRPSRCCSSGWS